MDIEGMVEHLKEMQAQWLKETDQQQTPLRTDYDCARCKDTEILLVDDVAVPCECAKRKRLARLMKSCNISDEIERKGFAQFDESEISPEVVVIKRLCMEYAEGLAKYYERNKTLIGAPSLGLCGTSGMGKTHLMMAIAGVVMERTDIVPMFFNWVSSFKEWLGYYNSQEDKIKVNQIREKLYNTPLLILDDLCKDCTSPAWVTEMYGIIDYRYRKKLPIVFSSEYYSELVNLLSEAVFGRLREMTKNQKSGKYYFATCFVKNGEDPLKYNYRLRGL